MAGGAGGQLGSPLVGRRQLGQVADGTLEVVPDDLLVLARALAFALQPVRVALMKIGALRLEDALVGHVAQEDVLEAERPGRRSVRRPPR